MYVFFMADFMYCRVEELRQRLCDLLKYSWSFTEVCWSDVEEQTEQNPSRATCIAHSCAPYIVEAQWRDWNIWRSGKPLKSQLPFFSIFNVQSKEAHPWTKGEHWPVELEVSNMSEEEHFRTQSSPLILEWDGGGKICMNEKKKMGQAPSMDCDQFDCQCQPQIVLNRKLHRHVTPPKTLS